MNKIIILILICVAIISFTLFPSVYSEKQIKSIEVSAGQTAVHIFNLEKGETLHFSFSVTGGNDDINFWVTDPTGFNIIRKQGITGGMGPGAFEATISGAHSINFDNSFSIFSSKMVTISYEIEEPYVPEGGGCLIATATYGSELAPQVQILREIRDNSLLQTQSGQSFMKSFNSFYYSFSPTIADYERQNPVFKEAVKLTITPLLASLSILNYVDLDSEESVLGYGIGIILMNIGMYFVAPAIVISKIRKLKI